MKVKLVNFMQVCSDEVTTNGSLDCDSSPDSFGYCGWVGMSPGNQQYSNFVTSRVFIEDSVNAGFGREDIASVVDAYFYSPFQSNAVLIRPSIVFIIADFSLLP